MSNHEPIITTHDGITYASFGFIYTTSDAAKKRITDALSCYLVQRVSIGGVAGNNTVNVTFKGEVDHNEALNHLLCGLAYAVLGNKVSS
jgi:hypothetical protein